MKKGKIISSNSERLFGITPDGIYMIISLPLDEQDIKKLNSHATLITGDENFVRKYPHYIRNQPLEAPSLRSSTAGIRLTKIDVAWILRAGGVDREIIKELFPDEITILEVSE